MQTREDREYWRGRLGRNPHNLKKTLIITVNYRSRRGVAWAFRSRFGHAGEGADEILAPPGEEFHQFLRRG